MATSSRSRLGVASIAAGSLYFLGQAGELVFGSRGGVVGGLFIALVVAGFAALAVAFWELRAFVTTRAGRVGVRIGLAGMAFLMLFSVQLVVEALRTGDLPENFLLFAIGFLLLLVAHPLVAASLRRKTWLGRAWLLLLVAVAGIVVFITAGDALGPVHDLGLFLFEGAWVAFGVAVLRAGREPAGPRARSQAGAASVGA